MRFFAALVVAICIVMLTSPHKQTADASAKPVTFAPSAALIYERTRLCP
jgi:hypothetical protein